MMKTRTAIKQYAIGVMVTISAGLVNAQAQESVQNTSFHETAITAFPPLLEQGILTTLPIQKNDVSSEKSPIVLFAPAPALTYVAMYAIGSSNCNWEYMTSQYQSSTTCDHGGSQLRAAVIEIGYSANRIAKMINGLLPLSANYLDVGICIVNGQYSFTCNPGATYVGWLRHYNLDGHQIGLFEYQSTSANPPTNTFYTSINIK